MLLMPSLERTRLARFVQHSASIHEQFRYLDTPTHTTDLIPQVLTPQEIYLADHTSWSNARPDALVR